MGRHNLAAGCFNRIFDCFTGVLYQSVLANTVALHLYDSSYIVSNLLISVVYHAIKILNAKLS